MGVENEIALLFLALRLFFVIGILVRMEFDAIMDILGVYCVLLTFLLLFDLFFYLFRRLY